MELSSFSIQTSICDDNLEGVARVIKTALGNLDKTFKNFLSSTTISSSSIPSLPPLRKLTSNFQNEFSW